MADCKDVLLIVDFNRNGRKLSHVRKLTGNIPYVGVECRYLVKDTIMSDVIKSRSY